ncbi:MAG: family 16 glycosylhydrolase [Pseudonocardia sp.]|nr:family 16 glycosylhydrolase [Pseudonocardia sp.]
MEPGSGDEERQPRVLPDDDPAPTVRDSPSSTEPENESDTGESDTDERVVEESSDDERDDGEEQEAESDADDRSEPDQDDGTDPDLDARGPADSAEPGIEDSDATEPTTTPSTREPDTSSVGSRSEGSTAAEHFGWGIPAQEDDFTSADLAGWELYDGPGHAGEGTRSGRAVTVGNGILTITGDAEGTTGGMTWGTGQRYGRWEGRVRAPASDPSYNALLLLWPDAEDVPVGGEIDFMEMLDPTRQETDFFLHFGENNDQITSRVDIDATEWHNWAVEWTPEAITGYVDGEEWFSSTDPTTFPPGPMHLCIQLDWFPEGSGEVQESTMEVEWVRQYALEDATAPPRERVSTEPAGSPAAGATDPLLGMFSWG